MKKGLITFVLTSTLIGLTGCAGNNQNAGSDNNGGHLGVNNVRNNVRNNDNNGVTGRNVSNQNLRVSTHATNNVERLGEVDQAHVIIRNNDAYVAVRLNNQQGTTVDRTGTGTRNPINTTNNRDGNGTGYTQYTDNTGITGNKTNAGTTGRNMNKGTGSITGNNTVARTEGLNGTNTGVGTNGLTGTNTNTGNNGNVGTNTGNTGTGMNGNNVTGDTTYKEVSTNLEQRIADQVRAADKKIHNVYVSYDNDFYNQMNNYTNDIQNGRNRNGTWDSFTDTVRRVFQ